MTTPQTDAQAKELAHSPEPWAVRTDRRATEHTKIFSAYSCVASLNPYLPTCQHNAQRVVQCVNACAGLPDPQSAIDAAREALNEADAIFIGMANAEQDIYRSGYWHDKALKARKALALLEGKK